MTQLTQDVRRSCRKEVCQGLALLTFQLRIHECSRQVCNCSSSWWHCMVIHDYYSCKDTWPSSSLLVVVSWRLPFRMHSTAFSHRERVEHYTMQNVSTCDLVLLPLGGANTTKNDQHTAHDHDPWRLWYHIDLQSSELCLSGLYTFDQLWHFVKDGAKSQSEL